MVPILLDLTGHPGWRRLTEELQLRRADLSTARYWSAEEQHTPLVIDGRGRHPAAIELLQSLPRHTRAERVLITDREAPADHALAYLAGATRILVLGAREELPLLSEVWPSST